MRHPPHFGRTLATVGGGGVVVVVVAVDVPTFGHRGGRGQCSGSGGAGRTIVVMAKPIVGFQMPPKSAVGTGRRSSLVGTGTAGTGTGTGTGTGALQVVRDERVVRAGVV